MEFLRNVPEFLETEPEESILARNIQVSQWKELGPPDLVHLTKNQIVGSRKEVGSYHFVSGIDSSSSATIAAYINSLQYAFAQNQSFFGKNQTLKLTKGVYCCFNAFSKLDMRVSVTIPGSVETFAIDDRGRKTETNSQLWMETYLSSILRSLKYSNKDSSAKVVRRLNPLENLEAEQRFLDAAEKLFFKGPFLGCEVDIQIATLVSNHLTDSLMQYFRMSGRWEFAANMFEKLRMKEPQVAILLAQTYLEMDEEVKAVKLMSSCIKTLPMNWLLLDLQSSFLRSKNEKEIALQCANKAVSAAPVEFRSWATLTDCYIESEKYDLALLTLNSCPMLNVFDRDDVKMPPHKAENLPIPADCDLPEIIHEDDISRDEIADQSLIRLPSLTLRGTYAQAYTRLTILLEKIGWDELLKVRSMVFVMEEEYRNEKSKNAMATSAQKIQEPAGHAETIPQIESDKKSTDFEPTASAEEINDEGAAKETTEDDENSNSAVCTSLQNHDADSGVTDDDYRSTYGVEKPSQIIERQLDQPAIVTHTNGNTDAPFHHKRLCERWLDHLFMVLYEDLRVYTIWRAEIAHFRTQTMMYQKNALEWEILGDLASRLHHKNEAIEAFSKCLELKFSTKAWKRLLDYFEEAQDFSNGLTAISKLTAFNHRWYSEFSPDLIDSFRRIMAREGMVKVRSTMAASTMTAGSRELMKRYLQLQWVNAFEKY
ncbi:hypothetical protein NEOLI_001270 [Neolecta irregularis DAH-3]|uniref:Uncharacterized protein n=1 Tax=Neolecta irregularis (strain DAH-3) TaxID=1198029 RepID=A0A1U7LUS8_NEOID|nr:hypothetical protein NEOLI_001270 [Neolecta irregularis DAH-3]|eukprot:OLL26435.1 hypothetical protein NEOLI_001270 [Neolecta irregularis DAH-3]